MRSPAAAPALGWCSVLGLFADVMLSRPIGLGALGLVLAAEAMRGRAALLPRRAVRAGMAGGGRAASALMLAGDATSCCGWRWCRAPGLGPLLAHLVATALAYPVVVGRARLGAAACAPRAAARRRPAGAARVKPPPNAQAAGPAHHPPGADAARAAGRASSALLGWRMRDLQIEQSEHYRLLAEENRINIRLIPPARGMISTAPAG